MVSGAHARLLSTFDRTLCAVRRGPRVIPQKVTSYVTKNPNNTSERGASVYNGKKTVKNRRSFKRSHFGGGLSIQFFLQCLGVD